MFSLSHSSDQIFDRYLQKGTMGLRARGIYTSKEALGKRRAPVAAVAQHGADRMAWPHVPRQFHRAHNVERRAGTDKDALLLFEVVRHINRLLV